MTAISRLILDALATPLGQLLLVADDDAQLHHVAWPEQEAHMRSAVRKRYPGIALEQAPARTVAGAALQAYFDGEVAAIERLRVAPHGTPFQSKIWAALRAIGPGRPWTYAELARHVGHPQAARAVGAACGANPVGIVVPCHRVVGTNGALTGFSGGLPRKQWLLRHEQLAATR